MATLLSHEQRSLESFKQQTRGAQEQILSAAIRDPKTSGPLIIAYRAAMRSTCTACGFVFGSDTEQDCNCPAW